MFSELNNYECRSHLIVDGKISGILLDDEPIMIVFEKIILHEASVLGKFRVSCEVI